MKYLFSVTDMNEDRFHLYSLKAGDEESAKEYLVKKFMPYTPGITFSDLEDFLASVDISLMFLGEGDKIEEL